MNETAAQTNLRLPTELKNRLMDSARKNNRSFGAEVIQRLQQSYEGVRATDEEVDSMAGKLAAIDERMAQMDALLADIRKMLVTQVIARG